MYLTSQSLIKRQSPCENVIIKATVALMTTFSSERQVHRVYTKLRYGESLWKPIKCYSQPMKVERTLLHVL